MSVLECQALAGIHAISGNDYISSFFRKGKKLEAINNFCKLSQILEGEMNLNKEIEKFNCAIYGYNRLRSVDQIRKKIFVRKFKQEGKTIDLSLLPPCASNLNLHAKRANCIARNYKQANNLMMNLDDTICHGSDGNYQTVWDESPFPEDCLSC